MVRKIMGESKAIQMILNSLKKDWRLLLLPSIILLLAFLVGIEGPFIDLYPIFYAIMLAYFCGLDKNDIQTYHTADKDSYFNNLTIISSLSFAVISFIIGINTNTISQYDKTTHNEDKYKWLKTSEILAFPIDQYNFVMKKKNHHVNILSSDYPKPHLPKPDTLLNIFIIDKTSSINNTHNYRKSSRKFSEFLSSEIADGYDMNAMNTNIENVELSDLVFFYLIKKIYEKPLNDEKSKSKIAVFIYDGTEELKATKVNYFYKVAGYPEITDYPEIIENYKNRLNSISKRGQRSDINTLMSNLSKRLRSGWAKADAINIHIISDFYDETPKKGDNINNYYIPGLKELRQSSAVRKISLLTLPDDNESEQARSTRNSFIYDCEKISLSDCIVVPVLLDYPDRDIQSIKNTLSSIYNDNILTLNKIDFNFPYFSNYAPTSQCDVSIDPTLLPAEIRFTCTNLGSDETIKLTCNRRENGSEDVLFANDGDFIRVDKEDILSFSMASNCSLADKNLMIEFDHEKRYQKVKHKLSVVSILPLTTSIYLNLLYIIFVISTSLTILIPFIVHFGNMSITNKWTRAYHLTSAGMIMAFNLWYLRMLLEIGIDAIITYCVVAAISVFLIRRSISKA